MSTSFPTQGYHVVYMCPDVIFQILPPCSRPMSSHHVTCHVTAVSCASSSSKRKIKERKNKIVSVQTSHNNLLLKPRSPYLHSITDPLLLPSSDLTYHTFCLPYYLWITLVSVNLNNQITSDRSVTVSECWVELTCVILESVQLSLMLWNPKSKRI